MLDIILHALTAFWVGILVFSGIWTAVVQTKDTGQRVGGVIAAIGAGVAGYYGGWRWGVALRRRSLCRWNDSGRSYRNAYQTEG